MPVFVHLQTLGRRKYVKKTWESSSPNNEDPPKLHWISELTRHKIKNSTEVFQEKKKIKLFSCTKPLEIIDFQFFLILFLICKGSIGPSTLLEEYFSSQYSSTNLTNKIYGVAVSAFLLILCQRIKARWEKPATIAAVKQPVVAL